jgi:hypothetical protein
LASFYAEPPNHSGLVIRGEMTIEVGGQLSGTLGPGSFYEIPTNPTYARRCVAPECVFLSEDGWLPP